jgi:hypothetical protein
VVRRSDHAVLSGVGFGAVSKGELFALLYHAQRAAQDLMVPAASPKPIVT